MTTKCRFHVFDFRPLAAAVALVLLAHGQPGARTNAKVAQPAQGGPAQVRALTLPDDYAGAVPAPGGAGKRAAPPAAWTAWREPAHQTPVFVQLNLPPGAAKRAAAAPEAEVFQFIAAHAELFRLRDPAAELVHRGTRSDRSGGEHVHLEHHYLGVPVWGSSIVGHWNPEQGLYAINGRYLPSPDYITEVEPAVTGEEAIRRASGDLARHTAVAQLSPETRALLQYPGPEAGLYLWNARMEDPLRLAWSVEIRPNIQERWRYFVDAGDGRILDRYLASPSDGPAVGSGTDLHGNAVDLQTYESDGLFYLIDGSREGTDPGHFDLDDPKGALLTLDARYTDVEELELVVSADNTFADPVAVSAHANMERVYEYFLENHGRRGIAGDGSEMISVIHVTEDGEPMQNAYWNGVLIAYGDGGDTFGPLAGSLDVAAHEMTHGIIERSVNLEYRFQSGALNESFADVFSAMVDDDDWLVGEDIVNEAVIPSGALRDLRDPHNGDEPGGKVWQPAHMDEYQELAEDDDNGGVHLNSGIPNRAAYLVAEAVGREKTAQIYYRILEASYLTARSQFVDCRLAAERAARDLFGDGSAEVQAVSRAYDAVGIIPEEPATSPGAQATGSGASWVSTVTADPGDNSLWLVKPAAEVGEGWEYRIQLTDTPVLAATGHAVTAPVQGDFLLFVDGDHNLRYIRADGSGEVVINDDGDWHSIALSPDGSRLAATTVYDEPSIWYFDLNDPENGRVVELYHPTTQEGIRQAIARYADALQWDATGNYVIYDAFNSLPGPAEETIDFWTVNMLDPLGGTMWSIFPPQPEGVHIGNPSLSSALLPDGTVNDCRLLYERIDEGSGRSEISVIDLCTGEEGVLHAVDGAAFPGFINGDREIVFEEWTEEEGGSVHLRRLPLAEDGLSPAGGPSAFVTGSHAPKPVIFAGDDIPLATAVEDREGDRQPTALSLAQNYPNPFNAGTLIPYSLASASRVILDIFNTSGQRVAAVDQGLRPPGTHAVSWNGADASGRRLGSGVYFYRLRLPGAEREVERQTRRMLLLR